MMTKDMAKLTWTHLKAKHHIDSDSALTSNNSIEYLLNEAIHYETRAREGAHASSTCMYFARLAQDFETMALCLEILNKPD